MAGTDNTLTIKLDKDTTLPLLEGLGKSAYAIAVAHGFQGTEQEWLNSLRGPKGDPGDKGDPFKFSDFTPEQLNALKGKKGDTGDPGSAENAALELKKIGIYLPDSSVDTVLTALIKNVRSGISFTPKPLQFAQPKDGATYIDFTGEPHFKLSINGGEKREFESDNMRVAIDSTMKGTITVDYYDLVDNLVRTRQIDLKGNSESGNGDNNTTAEYDFGNLVKTTDLSSGEGIFARIRGKAEVYSKGKKIIADTLSTNDDNSIESSIYGWLFQVEPTSGDYIEVNLSKIPSGDIAMADKVELNNWLYNFKYLILKVNKANVVKAPRGRSGLGKAETIKITGDAGKFIKINNSSMVETQSGKTYTYSFATNQITSD